MVEVLSKAPELYREGESPFGSFEGKTHVFPLRIYYEDTDAAGLVYFANYLKFTERARTDMLRMLGIGQRDLWNDQGIGFAVVRCDAQFLAPARLDDRLDVHTRVIELRGASLSALQVVRRDRTDLVRVRTRLACIEQGGRAKRLPALVRSSLEPFCQAEPIA
jgi:acyl-CoA thioester hydrolase